ncbi:MAG TPA: class I SAM-dependent methyltransferase [Bacteroidia bacterium]|nr:class I SAM-dependent methyltransferase [Bacteroidia bacterium]
MKLFTYHFHFIESCNMCLADSAFQKILGRRLNQSQGKNPSGLKGIATTIVKCKNCGLIFSNPMPVPESIDQHYGLPPEDYWKPSYFEKNPHYFKIQIAALKKLKPIEPGMKSLDIGAGLGKAMIALQDAGFDSYGFEPSQPFYERALSKMNISKEKLKLGSIEDVNYQNEFFDFISFGAVLEHLYNPSDSIKKALSWLKPGGLIHIEVPSSRWLINKIANIYYKLRCTDYVANISPMHTPFHLYEFDLNSFRKNAEVNNYEISWFRYWNGNTYLPALADPVLNWIMSKTQTGMQLEIWLRKK